jgi:hypothetical protein
MATKRDRAGTCRQSNRMHFQILAICCAFCLTHHETQGLSPSAIRRSSPRQKTRLDFAPTTPSDQPWRSSAAIHSSLFRRHIAPPQNRRHHSTSTARNMVLTTPESIIEQASTQKLLDDLIDESVRTSSRKPIMMQFDPSSSFVSIGSAAHLLYVTCS